MNNLQFPIRININFALSEDIEKYARELNEILLEQQYNEIDFSLTSDHLPHITLLMGEVDTSLALDELIRRCETFHASSMPIAYEISTPFWKKPSQKFLFIDTLPMEIFKRFRVSLYSELEGLLHCEFHGGPENPSHITIGYGDPRRIGLPQLARLKAPKNLQTQSMRICLAGERGTCHTVLAEFGGGIKA